MRVGVPSEVKNHEYRVACTPSGVHELVRHGHQVFVEKGAGTGSSLPDADFVTAGATMRATADEVWAEADLVLKVKEPIEEEYHRLRKDLVLFTYLHLAASEPCTEGAAEGGHHRHRLRDGAAAGRFVAVAGADVGGGRPHGAASRRPPPPARRRRSRRAHGWRVGCVRGEGGGHRGRRLRHECGGHRPRHAGRGAAARQQHRPPPRGRRDLPGPLPDGGVQLLRDRAGRPRRRSGDRRRTGAGGQSADAGVRTTWWPV